MKKFNLFAIALASIAQLFLSACVSDFLKPRQDPTKFYILSAQKSPTAVDGIENIMLNISQVRLPAYMMRQQIVSAKPNSSEIVISDIHRLPEFPVDAFTRVIATDISKIAKSENVYAYPGIAPETNAIEIRIIIVECMGVIGEELDFKARWELVKPDGSKIVAQTSKLFIKKFLAPNGYDDYIKAIDKALAGLSEDIVKGIVEFKKQYDIK